MDYQGDIIRPPSEAFSIILQVSVGCSHNRCTFCAAYRDRDKKFTIKSWKRITADLDFAATYCSHQTTLFLADGDALAMEDTLFQELLRLIKVKLPWVRRVSTYATCQNIAQKTDQQLRVYKNLGLRRIYMGLETGHDATLQAICKGVDAQAMITAGKRVRAAGLFLSVTCLLGIAGVHNSITHAQATAAVLNQMHPHQIAVLTLMLLPGTPLYRLARQGRFTLPDQVGLFQELHTLLLGLEDNRTQFYANHASNYFSLSGRLPKDKDSMIATIQAALAGSLSIKSEFQRAL